MLESGPGVGSTGRYEQRGWGCALSHGQSLDGSDRAQTVPADDSGLQAFDAACDGSGGAPPKMAAAIVHRTAVDAGRRSCADAVMALGRQPGGVEEDTSRCQQFRPGAEVPFTVWGQWPVGSLDLRVFEQDVYWVDINQRPHRIDQMTALYRRNVIRFLSANQDYYFVMSARLHLLRLVEGLLTGGVDGDTLAHALGNPAHDDLSPGEWLESTPLMRRLRAGLKVDGTEVLRPPT